MGARSEPALHPVSTTQPALHHPQPCALQSPCLRLSGVPDGPWRGTLLHCLNGLRWDAWQGNMGIMGYLISWNCCINFFGKKILLNKIASPKNNTTASYSTLKCVFCVRICFYFGLLDSVHCQLKGIVHPKHSILSLITHPHVVPKTFVHLRNTNQRCTKHIFPDAFDIWKHRNKHARTPKRISPLFCYLSPTCTYTTKATMMAESVIPVSQGSEVVWNKAKSTVFPYHAPYSWLAASVFGTRSDTVDT